MLVASTSKPSIKKLFLLLFSIFLSVFSTFFIFQESDWPREQAFMTGIFVLAACLWITEALPLFATALLVIGLEILLLSNPAKWPGLGFEAGVSPRFESLLSVTADPVLILFISGLLLAQVATDQGVDRAMAGLILQWFGNRPLFVLLGIMLITMLFSMWMSNTATTAMVMTLITPMLHQLPEKERFRKALVLGVPFAANIGGMGTPIGSPPNALAIGFLQKAGYSISFLQWMLVAIPFVLGLTLMAWLLLWFFFRPIHRGIRLESMSHSLTQKGWWVVSIFVITVILWMTDWWHGLPVSVVALFLILVLSISGLLHRNDLKRLEWDILILIAGGITLGYGIQITSLDRTWVDLLPLYSMQSQLPLLITLMLAGFFLSIFMTNTTTAGLLLPIALSAASSPNSNASVSQIILCVTLAASVEMASPISTPPNAIAYAKGEITFREMVQVGIILGILALILIICFGSTVMNFWGVR